MTRGAPPVSVERGGLVPTRWDVLAVLLVLGLATFLAHTSRDLFQLLEATRCFHFSPWMRFWRVEVPFAMPALVWNMMVSMSGGWFFVVASEAITIGNTTVTLPGVGSYIATAIAQRDTTAIGWAIGI